MEYLSEAVSWISAVIVGLIALAFLLQKWSSRNEPPGPWGVPVLGYLPFLGRKMCATVNDLSKKYGEVFQLKMGSRKVIVISGDTAIREAKLDYGTTFGGRPDFYSFVTNPSFAFYDYSPKYCLYRKTTMASINEFIKLHQMDIQNVGQNAAKMFMREVTFGHPFDPEPFIFRVTCTIIGYICYGQHFDVNDKDVTAMLELGKQFGDYAPYWLLSDYLPWTQFLLKNKLQESEQYLKAVGDYSEKLACKQSDKSCSRDKMVDICQQKCNKITDSEKAKHNISNATIRQQIYSLFGAAFGTTATTLRYSFMMMALYPDVQKKVHDELDRVVGIGIAVQKWLIKQIYRTHWQ